MKYTGRIGGIIFTFANALLGYILHPQTTLSELLLVTIGNLVLCSWLGKKYDEAKFYSEKDPLTEVYNRRFIIKSFPKILNKVNRNNENLSLFVIDIDDFKKINDTYGHEIGDSVIRGIAKAFLNNTRRTDVIALLGW